MTTHLRRLTLALMVLTHAPLVAAPQLATLDERIAFAEALLEKYPNILRHNLQFRQNLMESMRRIDDATKLLGEHVNSMDDRRLSILELMYSPADEVGYDLNKIDELKKSLLTDLGRHAFDSEGNMERALESLRERSTRNGILDVSAYKRSLGRLMRLLPLLYDAEGEAVVYTLETAAQRLQGLDPSDLDSLYHDTFLLHQAAIVQKAADKSKSPTWAGAKRGDWVEALRVAREYFIKKTVGNALAPVSTSLLGQVATPRYLRVEEIITPVDIFRGCFGKDCSILSVPLYPLVEGTKTYFIYKSSAGDSQPDGYAMVAPVEVNGHTTPYIITINGNLSSADAAKVIQAIAHDWNTDQYVYPDLKRSPHLVNSEAMRVGMAGKKAKALRVEMPVGWAVISKYLDENKIPRYDNYYAEAILTPAYLAQVRVQTSDLGKPISKKTYEGRPPVATGQLQRRRLLDRALLAANILRDGTDMAVLRTIRARYDLSAEQVSVAQALTREITKRTVEPSTYHAATQLLDFRFRDLKDLDIMTRLNTYNSLRKAASNVASADEWKSTYIKAWQDLGKAWEQTPDNERATLYDSFVEPFSMSIPAEHRHPPENLRSNLVKWAMTNHRDAYALLNQTEIDEYLPGYLAKRMKSHSTIRVEKIEFVISRITKHPPRWGRQTQAEVWNILILKIGHLRDFLHFLPLLRKIPEEFRNEAWINTVVSTIRYVSYHDKRHDQEGRPDLSAIRQMILEVSAFHNTHPSVSTAGLDTYLVELIVQQISDNTDRDVLGLISEVLTNPKYKHEIEKRFAGDQLKKRLFEQTDAHWRNSGGYPESLIYFERMGLSNEYHQYLSNFSWPTKIFHSPYRLSKFMTDPELSGESKVFLIKLLQADMLSSQEQARRGLSEMATDYYRNYEIRLQDLFDPSLRPLIGAQAHDRILDLLKEDLKRPYFTKLEAKRKQEFLSQLRSHAAESSFPEVSAQVFVMLQSQTSYAKLLRSPTRLVAHALKQRCMKLLRKIGLPNRA